MIMDYGIFAVAEYRKAIAKPLFTDASIGYALGRLMSATGNGYACAVLLDSERRHLSTVTLKRNGNMAGETVITLIDRAVKSFKPSFLLIGHSHHGDETMASGTDIVTTSILKERFNRDGLRFIDHFIISGNRWDTVLNAGYRECYAKHEDNII